VLLTAFLIVSVASLGLVRWVGEDFFPTVDSGQFKLHLRAPTGTRIEETAALCDHVQETIRRVIPGHEIVSVIDTASNTVVATVTVGSQPHFLLLKNFCDGRTIISFR